MRAMLKLTMLAMVAVLTFAGMLIVGPGGAVQPAFQASIDITGDIGVNIDESTTLTASWTANRDVTRYEWLVDGVSQGEKPISGGSSAGSLRFDFSADVAKSYAVTLRIWNHQQTDCDASASVTVTVEESRECEWVGETVWAAGDSYGVQDNRATYTPYAVNSTVILYAGQTMEAGTVHFSAANGGGVTITISLNNGWRFRNVAENVKIQNYAEAPSGSPNPSRFETQGNADANSSSFMIVAPENTFYGICVEVEWEDCP